MKTLKLNKSLLCIILVSGLFFNETRSQNLNNSDNKHTIQLNALEFMGHIYSLVYLYEFQPQNRVMLGLAYQNNRYDFGTTHAPSMIIGYRRYFWKNWNAELAFWPAFNSFYEKNEQKYYNGFELWSEFRAGYDFDFNIGQLKCFLLPQFILGKGITSAYKPQSFKDYYKNDEPVFIAGNLALGIKF